ncbi:unnamed protein product [Ambrosiozyma monospora]|uniref:Unnamed protein product n=1 Tax=Ambrosiozyma monospora TaxID=43982 RepID=A0ACB5T346_AMBMO|nr:unnamed protein product [Ambrosiozyma monospora]
MFIVNPKSVSNVTKFLKCSFLKNDDNKLEDSSDLESLIFDVSSNFGGHGGGGRSFMYLTLAMKSCLDDDEPDILLFLLVLIGLFFMNFKLQENKHCAGHDLTAPTYDYYDPLHLFTDNHNLSVNSFGSAYSQIPRIRQWNKQNSYITKEMESRTNEWLPFKGLKCSSTSISSLMKKDLANKIEIMGGTFVSDLLADTEVLIVGDVTTDKYKFCARKRADIKLIGPETISNVHRLFMNNAKEFDKSILDEYPMPTFENFNICMSRLPAHKEKIYEKEYLVALVRELGGSVSEALTKDSTIVVAVERKGKRYTKAIEWGVPVVHPKWILDSAVRGAILDTKYYEIDKVPSADIGEDSCLVWDKLKDPVDYYQFNEEIYNKYYAFLCHVVSILMDLPIVKQKNYIQLYGRKEERFLKRIITQ